MTNSRARSEREPCASDHGAAQELRVSTRPTWWTRQAPAVLARHRSGGPPRARRDWLRSGPITEREQARCVASAHRFCESIFMPSPPATAARLDLYRQFFSAAALPERCAARCARSHRRVSARRGRLKHTICLADGRWRGFRPFALPPSVLPRNLRSELRAHAVGFSTQRARHLRKRECDRSLDQPSRIREPSGLASES